MYKQYIKHKLDFIITLALLFLIVPIILIIGILLYISNRSQPFFFQERPGKNGKIFQLIKFKTMSDKTDINGKLLPDAQRLTKLGKFIRTCSFDEIPQFINVLKGDMSLVGPRPLLVKYLPLYNELQARRHEVRPGLTGLAQVNGRNNLTWEDKFELDVWYVDNVSFLLDMKILFLTLLKVLKREGINSSNAATMEKFTGTRHQ
jgi:undecaprenyl phosphate N,N'-diacetylbacillosamine 1-phosphate transferase